MNFKKKNKTHLFNWSFRPLHATPQVLKPSVMLNVGLWPCITLYFSFELILRFENSTSDRPQQQFQSYVRSWTARINNQIKAVVLSSSSNSTKFDIPAGWGASPESSLVAEAERLSPLQNNPI